MNVLRVNMPILALIALGRHGDLTRAAILQIQSFGFQRHLCVFIRRQIVVNNGRDRHVIALTEEARDRQPYHQILADDYTIDCAADLGVDSYTSHRCPPRGERIRESELSGCAAALVRFDICQPQCRIGKNFAHLGLNQRLGRLELRQAVIISSTSASTSQNHGFVAGLAGEVKAERGFRAHSVTNSAVKESVNVLCAVGVNGVDGFIYYTQAEFADGRLAIGIERGDVVPGCIAGLELRLRRFKADIQLLLVGWYFEILPAGVERVILDEGDCDIDVRLGFGRDGNRNHGGCAGALDDLLALDGAALGCHQHLWIGDFSHEQQVGSVTNLVGPFVWNDLDLVSSRLIPGGVSRSGNPYPGPALDYTVFGCAGADSDD